MQAFAHLDGKITDTNISAKSIIYQLLRHINIFNYSTITAKSYLSQRHQQAEVHGLLKLCSWEPESPITTCSRALTNLVLITGLTSFIEVVNTFIPSNDFQSVDDTTSVTEGAPCRTDCSNLLTRETMNQIWGPAEYSHTLRNWIRRRQCKSTKIASLAFRCLVLSMPDSHSTIASKFKW